MYQKTQLDNGLRIVTSTMAHTRSVSLCVFIGAGSRYEPSERAGISHFIEHLCFKGTRRRPTSRQISEAIEGVGGILNGGTDRELTVYWIKVARDHFDQSLDLLIDILRSSTFDPKEVEKERLVLLEELNMINDYPGHRAEAMIDELLWPDNPLGRDVGGTRESVKNIARKQMLDYMGHQYIPSNIVVSVAGNIEHGEVVEKATPLITDWPTSTSLTWYTAKDSQGSPQFRLERRKTDQAHLCIAFHGLSADHTDRYALDLLNTILGEGMSSRLFLEVREKQGLAYDVHSSVDHFLDCGSLTVYAGVDPKRAPRAIETILAELGRVKDGIPEEEMGKARELLKGRLLLRMEDTRAVSGWMGTQELLRGSILSVDEVVSRLEKVTLEDVQRVARQLLTTEHLNLSIVGPYRSERQFQNLLSL